MSCDCHYQLFCPFKHDFDRIGGSLESWDTLWKPIDLVTCLHVVRNSILEVQLCFVDLCNSESTTWLTCVIFHKHSKFCICFLILRPVRICVWKVLLPVGWASPLIGIPVEWASFNVCKVKRLSLSSGYGFDFDINPWDYSVIILHVVDLAVECFLMCANVDKVVKNGICDNRITISDSSHKLENNVNHFNLTTFREGLVRTLELKVGGVSSSWNWGELDSIIMRSIVRLIVLPVQFEVHLRINLVAVELWTRFKVE